MNGALVFKEDLAMRFPIGAFLILVSLLLLPAAASAQEPAKDPSHKVVLQITFVAVKMSDLDALGINFDLVPIPALSTSPKQFLATATGSIVTQSYGRLTQTSGVQSHFFTPASAVVPDSMPATFAVHAQFRDTATQAGPDQKMSFPRLTSSSQIDGRATFTPHIGVGNIVSLEMESPLGNGRTVRLGAVPSGQQIVINTSAVEAQEASSIPGIAPQIQTRSRNVISDEKELLIFITPTVFVGTPGKAVVAAPEKTITFNIINGDLQLAIERIKRQCSIQCLVQDGVDVHRTMSINMSDLPLSQALHLLASTVNAQVTQNLDGVYVFTPKPVAAPKGPVDTIPPVRFGGSFGNVALFAEPFPYSMKFLHVHTPPVTLNDMLNGRDPGHTQPGEVRRIFALSQSF